MLQFLGITYDNEIETTTSIENINLSQYQWFWVDFNEPTPDEIKHLSETFQFHPLAIEDCTQRLQRPKLDYYGDYTFFITHMIREEQKEIVKEELDIFVSARFIVTFHLTASKEITYVWNLLQNAKTKTDWDTFYIFYKIIDKLVDNYFPVIYKIEEELDKIEDNTYRKSMHLLMDDLFDTRHMLLSLIHTINPMRDLLYRMLGSQHLYYIKEKRQYFSDIYDHLLKLSEMVMTNREITADIRDSYLSLNSHQTNNVMKVLTIITSIFAPLTFIVGIYGMNFEHMPELTWKYGYLLVLILMATVALSMYSWFRSKGWFK